MASAWAGTSVVSMASRSASNMRCSLPNTSSRRNRKTRQRYGVFEPTTPVRLTCAQMVRTLREASVSEHRYHVDGYSAAPPEVVFDVLVDGPGWADWAPGLKAASYECEGEPAPHGVGAIRRFGAGVGPVSREQVVAYERPDVLLLRVALGPAALARLPRRGAPHARARRRRHHHRLDRLVPAAGCPAWAPSSTAWSPGSPRAWWRSRSGEPPPARRPERPRQRQPLPGLSPTTPASPRHRRR